MEESVRSTQGFVEFSLSCAGLYNITSTPRPRRFSQTISLLIEMLGEKSLSVYSKPFSLKPDKATANNLSPNSSKTALAATKSPGPTQKPSSLTAASSVNGKPDATHAPSAADAPHPAATAAPSLPPNDGKPIKQADPRDFRRFTLADARARSLKLGQVNKIASPQRRADINAQIIEAARAKNAEHYVHFALQGLSRAGNQAKQQSIVTANRQLQGSRKERQSCVPSVKKVLPTQQRDLTVKYRSKSGVCRTGMAPASKPVVEAGVAGPRATMKGQEAVVSKVNVAAATVNVSHEKDLLAAKSAAPWKWWNLKGWLRFMKVTSLCCQGNKILPKSERVIDSYLRKFEPHRRHYSLWASNRSCLLLEQSPFQNSVNAIMQSS